MTNPEVTNNQTDAEAMFYICERLGVRQPIMNEALVPHLALVLNAILDRIEMLENMQDTPEPAPEEESH